MWQRYIIGNPVLSSDFGLMVEVTCRYGFGLAVDSTVPGEIAKGFSRFLLESPPSLWRLRQDETVCPAKHY